MAVEISSFYGRSFMIGTRDGGRGSREFVKRRGREEQIEKVSLYIGT